MPLFLIRHPPPAIEAGRCYGRLDVPARAVAEHAARLAPLLPPGIAVVASPLARCRALAEALSPAPTYDARLMEIDFGAWEGLPWSAIGPDALDAWAADLMHHAPPGGESVARLAARVRAWAAEQAAEIPLAVVTHAGVMRVLVGDHRGLSETEWTRLQFDYGACVRIEPPAG